MHTELGFSRPVALRVLREPWDRDRAVLSALARTASEVAERPSPALEQVVDLVMEGDRGVWVTEWLDGVSLRRLLDAYDAAGELVPWPLAATVAVEVLRGVANAHDAAISHESLDARSVRLSASGHVKVTRFGLASALAGCCERRDLERRGLRHGAPELTIGERATPASDRFGVGALLFEMLAGRAAYSAPGDARDAAMRAGDVPDLATLRPDVPALVVAQVERAMRLTPSERFESTRAMAKALAQLLQAEISPWGPEELAEAVRAVRERPAPPKKEARPQGLGEQRTMHVDLAELTVLPNNPADAEPTEENADRRPRYRFGYKERRANLVARSTPLPFEAQESEAVPLPLTRRAELDADAPREARRPQGLAPQKTEFLDAEQVDRLLLSDDPKDEIER